MTVSSLRKPLTDRVKLQVLARQANCFSCGKPFPVRGILSFVWASECPDHPVAKHLRCVDKKDLDVVRLSQRTRIICLIKQANCAQCHEPLAVSNVRFDHRPPLEQRKLNRSGKNFIPKQHNPDFIEAIHTDCHQWRDRGF